MKLKRREVLQSMVFAVGGAAVTFGAEAAGTGGAARKDEPIAVVVTIQVKQGREREFLELLRPVLDAMRHEETFVNAVLHRDPEDSSRFMIYETWADRSDLVEVQVHRDYRRAYMDALSDLLRSPRDIQVWQPVRSDFAFFAPKGT